MEAAVPGCQTCNRRHCNRSVVTRPHEHLAECAHVSSRYDTNTCTHMHAHHSIHEPAPNRTLLSIVMSKKLVDSGGVRTSSAVREVSSC